jgi:predicted Zn-ribbon and HTH transcriptional regulator
MRRVERLSECGETEWALMVAKSSKCKSCQSERQSNFNGEIGLHFPGRKGLDKPLVLVFPQLVVCLDCGFTEFEIPETELRVLSDGTDPSAVA